MSAIRIRQLGKAFRAYRSEWHRVANWFGANFAPRSEYWALKGVNLEVPAGAAVGVIGRNGAGKSTLLKLLTGTLVPTEGSVDLAGRVSAILELGMGFDPELTGRQNARHAAGLLGHDTEAIGERIAEIEAFAEIGDHFDAPVRTYSSGMHMRLAFSVATAWRPDVLIVDEALSVGDTAFQHKSFDRIRAFREQGTTLLLVSHDRSAIQSVCDRAVLLNEGRVLKEGDPDSIFDYYNALLADVEGETVRQTTDADGRRQTRSGSGAAVIRSVRLIDEDANALDIVRVGQPVAIEIRLTACRPLDELVVGYMIRDRLGQDVFGTNTHHTKSPLVGVPSGRDYTLRFRFDARLGEGGYTVTVALHAGAAHTEKNYDWWDRAVSFDVVNVGHAIFNGMAWLPPEMEVIDDPA